MRRCVLVAAMLTLLSISPLPADQPGERVEPADQVAIAGKVAPALVKVEYWLQFDKGDSPTALTWTERCPNCGRYHGAGSLETQVRQERPLEAGGLLVSADQVLTADAMLHERFVKEVRVRFGEQLVKASPAAFYKHHNAVLLKLAEPLKGAKPMAFSPDAKPPYQAVSYGRQGAVWTVSVNPLSLTGPSVTETGRKFLAAPPYCLIVDKNAAAVGVSMNSELPVDDSWKGSPLDWPALSAEQLAGWTAEAAKRADQAILRAKLNFRSPKKTQSDRYLGPEESATERDTLALVVGAKQVLVLANLDPKATARLERIVLYPPTGEPIAARFAHTLADYGGLIATVDTPLPGPIALSRNNIEHFQLALLLSAEVRLHGDQRVVHYSRLRIPAFELAWKRQVYPDVPGSGEGLFLLDSAGALVAFPIGRREKVAVRERWSSDRVHVTPSKYLAEVLDDLAANVDPNNVPLTEEEENRLAWLGVELQPLDRELARANNVSDLTRNGEMGALVSYVYPDSPAARGGVLPGFVLVRLHVEGQPKPLEVKLDRYEMRAEQFPWDRLDELPERYYDRVPQPWPAVENGFTRSLTDIGFGKTYKAEFFHDGRTVMTEFKIDRSPPHYDSAARFTSKELQLTVRDMTYEVRRYFQKKPDEPGVIVSKIEPGSKASVAGLKPYELITHVNDEAVQNVKDFERLVGQTKGELRLSVKRMARGRLVKIDMAAPAPTPATRPDMPDDDIDP